MKKYTLKASKNMLQVRHSGKIVCNLHLHKYFAPSFGGNHFLIRCLTPAADDFFSGLRDSIKTFIKDSLGREEVWNDGIVICTR